MTSVAATPPRRGLIIVLASPSGAGKSTLSRLLLQQFKGVELSVSVTTRPRRPSEVEGVHYHFVDLKRFAAMRERGELLEWAEVHGNYYGTPREPVEKALAEGRDILFDIDVKGTLTLYETIRPDMSTIFILPPSIAEQIARLRRRATDDEATILRRLATAREELAHWRDFDYVLVNDDLERAFGELQAIITAERRKRDDAAIGHLVDWLSKDLADVLASGHLPPA